MKSWKGKSFSRFEQLHFKYRAGGKIFIHFQNEFVALWHFGTQKVRAWRETARESNQWKAAKMVAEQKHTLFRGTLRDHLSLSFCFLSFCSAISFNLICILFVCHCLCVFCNLLSQPVMFLWSTWKSKEIRKRAQEKLDQCERDFCVCVCSMHARARIHS